MNNLDQETNSDLNKLRFKENALELSDTLRSLLERGKGLDEAATIVKERLVDGTFFLDEVLADLVLKTDSPDLYALVRDRFYMSFSCLHKLYAGGYPDIDIERALTKTLYKIASEDDKPERRLIVEAMKSQGSIDVAPVLKSILHDGAPELAAKKSIADAISMVGGLEAFLAKSISEIRASFLDLVANAIVEIERRNESVSQVQTENGEGNGLTSSSPATLIDSKTYWSELIAEGENRQVEFKETFSYDIRDSAKNSDRKWDVSKALAGFLNQEGGYLLIGVSDEGIVVGIDRDLGEDSEDKFIRGVQDHLINALGLDNLAAYMDLGLSSLNEKRFLWIHAKQSPSPVWAKENKSGKAREDKLYVRLNSMTAELKGRELTDYIKKHFE